MKESKEALTQPCATEQSRINLLCDGFRDQLIQNIRQLQQSEGQRVLDALDEAGQWHATQMNGFLKTLALPPITGGIIALHNAISAQNNVGNTASAEASIRHGLELSDLDYGGTLTINRRADDMKQAILLALHRLRQQMEAIQRHTATELVENSGDITLIRCSMILDGLIQSLKNLIQCLLCATFPEHCDSNHFGHIRIVEEGNCLFDSLSVSPRGRNTWAPTGNP